MTKKRKRARGLIFKKEHIDWVNNQDLPMDNFYFTYQRLPNGVHCFVYHELWKSAFGNRVYYEKDKLEIEDEKEAMALYHYIKYIRKFPLFFG